RGRASVAGACPLRGGYSAWQRSGRAARRRRAEDTDPTPARPARVVTRARRRATLETRSPRSRVAGIQAERRGSRPCLAALVENLDPALGSFELRVTEAGKLYAALE